MLLSHERSVKKEDMDRAELDAFLRQITPREQFYLDNPGAPSPRFKTMEHRTVRGRDVLYFHLQELPNDEIHLRKDSRFTDVPYYMHSNININYIYDGHCDYLIDDKPITLYKGDVCIFDLDVVRRKLTLGLNVKMLPLCSDGSVLGLTVFQRCGFTVTLGDGTKLVEIFMPKDVVIDSALAADGCTGCRNFTIAHEAAHQILADLFPNDYGKAVKCRGHIAYRERNGQPSWEEWQANTLAAELLMPTFLVNAEIERAALCLPNGILYKSASDPNYEKILEMAARMGVSWSAIRIRLQQMQVIKGKPIHCHPLDIIRFGE